MAKQPFDFGDYAKLFGDAQIPGVDWQEVVATQQKNLAALSQANQLLMQGAQAVIQREVEILQRAVTEAAEASRELMRQNDPQANAAKRFELARASLEKTLSNVRELTEIATRSNREALEVINRRALESFDEIRAAVEKQLARQSGSGSPARPSGGKGARSS